MELDIARPSARPATGARAAVGQTADAVRALGSGLLRSRILLAYILVGVVSGLQFGLSGLGAGLVNHFVLLPVYVLVIYLCTRREPTVALVNRPEASEAVAANRRAPRRRDLALVATLLVVNVAGLLWFWTGGLPAVVMDAVNLSLRGAGWERGLANTVANAVESVLFSLLPALLVVFALFRLPAEQTGLRPRHLGLGLFLIVLGVGLAYVVGLVFGRSSDLFDPGLTLPLVLALFSAQLLVNGLQEEFIFRGVVLTRVLAWFRNPHHALVLASALFVAMHIPSYAFRPEGAAFWDWLPVGYQPTGLVWGYLYYRTRSIWPGALWHASNYTLGMLFLG